MMRGGAGRACQAPAHRRGARAQVYKRSFWTETFVAWSPHGSYLATMHRQGAAIWGGPSFSRLQRFSHQSVRRRPRRRCARCRAPTTTLAPCCGTAPRRPAAALTRKPVFEEGLPCRASDGRALAVNCHAQPDWDGTPVRAPRRGRRALHKMSDAAPRGAQVRLIQFSPEETFLVTYSPVEPANPREKAGLVLNLFDSRTGRKLRNFAGSAEDYAVGAAAGPAGALKWPVFQWAGGCGDRRAPGPRLRIPSAMHLSANDAKGRRVLRCAVLDPRASGALGRLFTQRACATCRRCAGVEKRWARPEGAQPICLVGLLVGLPRRPTQRAAETLTARRRAGTLRGWAAARSACTRRPTWACWTSAR